MMTSQPIPLYSTRCMTNRQILYREIVFTRSMRRLTKTFTGMETGKSHWKLILETESIVNEVGGGEIIYIKLA